MTIRGTIPLVVVFLGMIGAALGQRSPLSLKTRIPLAKVEGRMDHFSIDVKGQRLFVASNANHTLEVIDLRAGRQVKSISDLDTPQGVFYEASTNRLFVANEGDGSVKTFDGTTFQLLQTEKLSSDADNIRYDARRQRVLVGYGGEKFLRGKVARGQGDGAIAFLDSTGKKVGEIAIDAHPESFQMEKTGTRLFVNVPDHHEVQVADLAKNSIVAHWPVADCTNFPMALDEAHHRLFLGCRMPAHLVVLDTENGKVIASRAIVDDNDDLFYDADKARIYILGAGFVEAWQQKDPDHYERIARYPAPMGGRTGFFSPDLGELFEAIPHSGQQGAEIDVYETR
jgi:DNA-binding beta-propeller fold protein YncE